VDKSHQSVRAHSAFAVYLFFKKHNIHFLSSKILKIFNKFDMWNLHAKPPHPAGPTDGASGTILKV
jgi:hypothetical protein